MTTPGLLTPGAAVLLADGYVQGPPDARPAAADTFVIELLPGVPGPCCAYGIEKGLREVVRRQDSMRRRTLSVAAGGGRVFVTDFFGWGLSRVRHP